MSKTEQFKDCPTCLHKQVCVHRQHYVALSSIALARVAFRCRFHSGKNPILPATTKQNIESNELGLSVDELAKQIDKQQAEDIANDCMGTCVICGKIAPVVKCSDCGESICLSCCEAEETVDMQTRDSSTSYVCKKCNEDID